MSFQSLNLNHFAFYKWLVDPAYFAGKSTLTSDLTVDMKANIFTLFSWDICHSCIGAT